MQIGGVVETALFVEDPERSERFYREVLGLATLGLSERVVVMSVNARDVLLLFKKGGSLEPIETPGGTIPPGDADGQMHVAFNVAETELDRWESRLRQHGVEIESKVNWKLVPWQGHLSRQSGRSIYFRDPDNHSLELITPGVWPGVY